MNNIMMKIRITTINSRIVVMIIFVNLYSFFSVRRSRFRFVDINHITTTQNSSKIAICSVDGERKERRKKEKSKEENHNTLNKANSELVKQFWPKTSKRNHKEDEIFIRIALGKDAGFK